MKNELRAYVESIRDEIKSLYDLTPEEADRREEEGESSSLWDYFADALDVEYTIGSRGEYLGARVYVTLGGPNVWVDTRRGEVGGAWGTDRESVWLPSEICDEIDSFFCEAYESLRA